MIINQYKTYLKNKNSLKIILVLSIFLIIIVLLLTSYFIVAKNDQVLAFSSKESNLTNLIPGQPLIVLELDDALDSINKLAKLDAYQSFLSSTTFKEFENSKLYLKISDFAKELSKLVQYNIAPQSILSIFYNNAAIAIYDIRTLRMVVISKIPTSEQAKIFFIQNQNIYNSQNIMGYEIKYLLDEKYGLSFAFCQKDDMIIAATDVTLIESTIKLINNSKDIAKYSDKPDVQILKNTDGEVSTSPIRIYLDLEQIKEFPHYKSYFLTWDNPNTPGIKSEYMGINVDSKNFSEKRIFMVNSEKSALDINTQNTSISFLPTEGILSFKYEKAIISNILNYFNIKNENFNNNIFINSTSSIIWTVIKQQEDELYQVNKVAAINGVSEEQVNSLVNSINESLKEIFIVQNQNWGLKNNNGIWSYEAIPGMQGIFLSLQGNMLFIGNNLEFLTKAKNIFKTNNFNGIISQTYISPDSFIAISNSIHQMDKAQLFDYPHKTLFPQMIAPLLISFNKMGAFTRTEKQIKDQIIIEDCRWVVN